MSELFIAHGSRVTGSVMPTADQIPPLPDRSMARITAALETIGCELRIISQELRNAELRYAGQPPDWRRSHPRPRR